MGWNHDKTYPRSWESKGALTFDPHDEKHTMQGDTTHNDKTSWVSIMQSLSMDGRVSGIYSIPIWKLEDFEDFLISWANDGW